MDNAARSGPVWVTTAAAPSYPALAGDVAVDTAIVGGGITGITAGLLLKRAGQRVAVLEGRRIGSGVTGRTTAHLTALLDERYQDLTKRFGEQGARIAALSSSTAINRIEQFVREEAIDCDFRRVPGYLYTEDADQRQAIAEEVQTMRTLDLDARAVDAPPLPFAVAAALEVPDQAQFNPLPYVYALAAALDGNGCHIFEQTRVSKVEDGAPCRVRAEHGTVTARQVIVATHTPINDLLAFQPKIAPYRSYVLGVRLRSTPPEGLFWDMMEPYHYTRSFVDEQGPLLIVGGADHKTGQVSDTAAHFQQLEQYVRERYDVAAVAYCWSSQVYNPADGLPYIGLYPTNKHVYVGTGYGGNGMTFGTLTAMLLSDALLGKQNEWQSVYDASRVKPLAGARHFVTENVNLGLHAIGSWFKTDDTDLDAVPAGEGRIISVRGEQIAAYRDESGALHTLSPTCSHAGCSVSWNNAEKSWDCPCHGGRFTAEGVLIEGPPVKGLEHKEL